MSRRVAVLLLALGLLPLLGAGLQRPAAAEAHPLGNFTINRYTRVLLGADGVSLRYVVDMAEIPAFQEIKAIDKDGDGLLTNDETSAYLARKMPELLAGMDLEVGGHRVTLTPTQQAISFPEGQGGLYTMRLVLDFTAPMSEGWQKGASATYVDKNFNDLIGWKEVVIQSTTGVALTESSVSTTDDTAELTAYPTDRLKSPSNITSARFTFEAGDSSTQPAPITGAPSKTTAAPGRSLDHFAGLVSKEHLTPAFVILALFAAMAWGAAHALGPGHGKTIVAAYLVGSRGTARHAVLLGLVVTATHTSTVVALGLGTLYAARFFPTQNLYLWLSVASGVMVMGMGVLLFLSRLRGLLRRRPALALADHDHADGLGHDHEHPQFASFDVEVVHVRPQSKAKSDALAQARAASIEHSHAAELAHGHSHELKAPGLRGLIMLGISGGLLPCPTALVVMLGAIALNRVAYGLVLILAFSVGLAGLLTAIGLLMVYAGKVMEGSSRLGRVISASMSARWLQVLPLLSSLAILGVGLVLTTKALGAV